MSVAHRITDQDTMKEFVLGGRAYFTLRNTETGGRVTYCVETNTLDAGWVVRAFTGNDNADRKHYSYLGNLDVDGAYEYAGPRAAVDAVHDAAVESGDDWLVKFCVNIARRLDAGHGMTARQEAALARNAAALGVVSSPLPPDDVKARGFVWFWHMLLSSKEFPPNFEFWHEGRCCRCARRLTVPESIQSGFGPECLKKARAA